VDIYEERGEYGPAIEVLTKLTTEESAREEAHAALMRLYALSGRHTAALGQYASLEEAHSPGTLRRSRTLRAAPWGRR
jgi:DNA-binding SARP family transcriptional activator